MIKMKTTQSKRYALNKTDLKKLGKGALFAMGGALITFSLEILPSIDFGENTVFIAGGIACVLNFLIKFFKG